MVEALNLSISYTEMLKRRMSLALIIGLGLLLVTVALTLGLPSVFRSRAVVLIEAQEIPQDLVRSLVTSFADQRIQVISQRVLTNNNLTSIITKYDLYADQRKHDRIERVLEQMRKDISVAPISADVVDPKQGRAVQATIAFELAYENKSPQLAQRVANEIVSLFLNENLKQRSETSKETLNFLTTESEKLRTNVADLESKLSKFKQGNVEKLPELTNLNLEMMNRTEQEVSQVDSQMRSLDQQRVYLESELAQQKPTTMLLSETGERILGPADRLRVLESEFVPIAARYGPNHPDVVAKRKEIESLRAQAGGDSGAGEIALKLQRAQSDYAQANKKYSPEHPDVKRLAREVDSLKSELATANRTAPDPVVTKRPDNPAYIQLQARLDSTTNDMGALRSQRATLKAKLAQLEDRITKSPEVEREYRVLTRDYDNAQLKYREILAKRQEAELASNLESNQAGEKFTLIEPPVIPEEPAKPNRLAIGLLGALLSMAGSVGSGALAESLDTRVYGRNGVTRLLGVPPLAVIPKLETEASKSQRRSRWAMVAAALLAVVTLVLLAIHFLVSPLDVLYFRGLRYFGF